MDDFDEFPIRLPSGTKAVIRLPRPFTMEDAVHMMNTLELYIEDEVKPKDRATHPTDKGQTNE